MVNCLVDLIEVSFILVFFLGLIIFWFHLAKWIVRFLVFIVVAKVLKGGLLGGKNKKL